MPSLPAVGLEHPLRVLRHMLLLSHLLALDTVLQVQSPQTCHSNPFISEVAMEEFGSVFERISCPLLKSMVTRQKVDMMLL